MTLLRLLLALYPRRLRRLHGEEMETFLEARLERARKRRGGTAAFTASVVLDALRARLPSPRRGWRGHEDDDTWTEEDGMGTWMQDLGYAARRLARTPLFTVGAVAIIALAIGANTAGFAVADALLFDPLPYAEPDRVVNVYQDSDDGEPASTSFPAYRDLAAMTEVFSSVAATSPATALLSSGEDVQTVGVEFATASLLPTLGLVPHRGRWFDADMDQVGAGLYAVVSHAAWQRRFGGDPGIIGRTVELNRQPVEIIGVGPRDFHGAYRFVVTDFWLSISSTPVGGDFRVANLERRQDHWYDVKARLAEGATVAQARQAADALALRLAEAFPEVNEGRGISVFPASEIRVHPMEDARLEAMAGALMTVVGLVLLLAATNLGSLLLVRGLARTPEVAVRRALGAGTGRVAGLFLGEALLLSVGGGLLGLLLAWWLVALLTAVADPAGLGDTLGLSGTLGLSIDGSVLAFSLGLMVATGLFFGWAPALQSLRTDVSGALREEKGTAGPGRRMSLFRNAMVAVQVAVSMVLVVGASLMVRSLAAYQRVDPGVDAQRLAFVRTTLSQAGISPEARAPTVEALTARLGALPGVEGVTLTTRIPVSGGGSTTTVVEGYAPPSGTGALELDFAFVAPGYFDVVGMPLVAGRTFTADDAMGDGRVAMVSEAAARRFWGDPDRAVGGRVRPQSAPEAWSEVVGVVADANIESLGEPPAPFLYYALAPGGADAPFIVVRTEGDPAALLGGMRAAVGEVDPELPLDRLETMEVHFGAALSGPRATAGLLGAFSALALLLAGVGIYTIVSLSVAARRSEIGLRMALGAARGRVVRLVTGRLLATVGLGMALGGALVVVLAPRASGLLFGVDPLDPVALLLATAVLAGAVTLASWVPARRAARVDPVEALRGP